MTLIFGLASERQTKGAVVRQLFLSVSGLTLGGTDASNYILSSTNVSGAVGNINQATLIAALTGTVNKTYDGTRAATFNSGNYALSGVVGTEVVNIANTSGTYDTKNVGTGKTVSVSGLTLSGVDASNYMLLSTSLSGAIGVINKKGTDWIYQGAVTNAEHLIITGTGISEVNQFIPIGAVNKVGIQSRADLSLTVVEE